MANVSNVKSNWQNVSAADYAAGNARALNNRLTAARLNAIGQAIIDINGEMATPDYSDLPVGATLTLWYNGGWPPRPTSRTSIIVQWCSVNYQGIPPTAIPGIDFLKVMEYQSIPDPDPDPPIIPDGNVLGMTGLESLTDGLPVTDSGDFVIRGPGTASLTARSAAAFRATMGMRGSDAAQSRTLAYVEASPAPYTRVVDFNFRINAITANSYIASIRDTVAGVNRADVRINGDRSVTCRSASVASGSSEEGLQLQTGTWYRMEWFISDALQRIRIYDEANDEYVMDFIGTISNAQADEYQIGVATSFTAGTEIDFDLLRVGDDWLEPYV